MSDKTINTTLKVISAMVLLAGFALISLQNDESEHPLAKAALEDVENEIQITVPKEPDMTAAPEPKPILSTVSEAPEEQPFLEQEVKARLVQVRDQFAKDIQYPETSRPIWNEDELKMFTPNRSSGISMPTSYDDASAPTLNLKTTKQRFMNDEPIVANAEIFGLESGRYTHAEARLVQNRETIAKTTGTQNTSSGEYSYQLIFSATDALTDSSSSSLMIIATYNIDGETYELATPVEYVQTIATLTSVESAAVNGEYLEIPINIETDLAGYHKVSANLYDAKTGKALIHLSGKNKLEQTSGTVLLQAHIASLKVMAHEGPYLLKDISLIRMPSKPRYLTDSGFVPNDSYTVSGFSFEDYDDVPYVNEKAQQRLDFLAQIGGEN